MTLRADRKKLSKKFKVGDVVTWGYGVIAHKVIRVTELGVWVDTSSQPVRGLGNEHFVYFAPANGREPGPPRHFDGPADVDIERVKRANAIGKNK